MTINTATEKVIQSPWFSGVPSSETQRFLALTKLVQLKKGDRFIEAGETPKIFGFVTKGLFRFLYTDQEGKEYTKVFMPEHSFVSAYSAMVLNQASYFSIEALEDSEVLTISYASWLRLKESHPCWNELLIKVLEKAFIMKEAREREFLFLDAESRYQIFLERFPNLEHRLKQHMIASYLGIAPESLSRVRKKEQS
ncbi:CRP-like cAMP-binding protein [Roseivirga ehrenbergii]|uniref:Cyclic nucleotide-binding protein n=1 Tax=Roseivirga ehrenbergii (strain DSM 102268 / JCM 13514 / KCTC 12282 / NCIMB 14502 / KMM 6017) TaxID=279360 RepID=A0A150XSY6_ROSEK|nr:Crp/Fnr family transcriptional regulator [Roseivirga ehrenbergii]KYG81879.1 cyclic nucleotide-binding protein [Roseivirga ehrenbergii]TCL01693.1 CRP-like cAMP-binding protein [Roseivirga ehrenbergii]